MLTSDRRLLVSIHDVAPCFEEQVDTLVRRVEAHVGRARFAMLVVPDHWARAPLASAITAAVSREAAASSRRP